MVTGDRIFISAVALELERYQTSGANVVFEGGEPFPVPVGTKGSVWCSFIDIYPDMTLFLIDWCGYEYDEEAGGIGFWSSRTNC